MGLLIPEGEEPGFVVCHDEDSAVAEVARLLDDLVVKSFVDPANILVITGHRALRDRIRSEDPGGWGCAAWEDRHSGGIVCETIHRTKGLECDAVIVVTVDETLEDHLLRVAMSRAVSKLVVVGPEALLERLQAKARLRFRTEVGGGERLELAPDGSVGPTGRSYWVVEGRFAAGAYPGKPGRRELDQIPEVTAKVLEAGIDTFVNLTQDYPGGTDGHLNHYDDDIDGAAVVKRFAIRDVSIPSVDLMVEVLDFIDDCLEHGRNPYVHCWGGTGRTGTVVGCWLIRHGYTDSDGVFDELARIRIGDLEAGHRGSPQVPEQWEFVRSWREGQ